MRFYFQSLGDDGQKVATKCIRVSNTATTEMVIEALVQKFRPDMRMLTHQSSYALYEVHTDEGTGMCVTGSFCALWWLFKPWQTVVVLTMCVYNGYIVMQQAMDSVYLVVWAL